MASAEVKLNELNAAGLDAQNMPAYSYGFEQSFVVGFRLVMHNIITSVPLHQTSIFANEDERLANERSKDSGL